MFAVKATARKVRHNQNQNSSVNEIKQLREILTLVVWNGLVTLYQALSTANQNAPAAKPSVEQEPNHMSRTISQKRIEANRRNAQKSTGPRTVEGKAKSSTNSTSHGFSSLNMNPVAPGCFLHTEDESQFRGLLHEYVVTYNPQHPDELDLLTEAVFAKWRQQRIWLAEAGQIEIAIAQGESELRKSLPLADARAHLANGIARSEAVLKLYLRYDAQLHRHYRNCLKDFRDLQAQRLPPNDSPNEPKPPTPEAEMPVEAPVEAPEPDEPKLTPEQARIAYMQSEIKRFEDYRAKVFRAKFPQNQPE